MLFGILCISAFFVVWYGFVPFVGYGLLLLVFILLGIVKIEYLLYVMIMFSFFHEWNIDFASYGVSRYISVLSTVHMSIADLFAFIMLISLCVAVLFGFFELRWRVLYKYLWPIFLSYAGFLCIAFLATRDAYGGLLHESVGYWMHPMFFVGLVYMIIPVMIIQTEKIFTRVLYILYGLGILISIYALASLFIPQATGSWLRVHPFPLWGGITPLGTNHNLLVEPLVTIIPFAVFLWYRYKTKLVFFLSSMMIVATLVSLSRAAWLSCIGMVLCALYIYRQDITTWFNTKNLYRSVIVVLCVFVLGVYMLYFVSSSAIVKSSTASRVDMNRITWFYAQEEILLGHGPGMFLFLLADTDLFRREYGDPLDAHGMIQKIIIEEGIIGFILFTIFIYTVLYMLWDTARHLDGRDRHLLVACMLMIVGQVIFQLFNTSYFKAVLWLPIGISLSLLLFYRSLLLPVSFKK